MRCNERECNGYAPHVLIGGKDGGGVRRNRRDI